MQNKSIYDCEDVEQILKANRYPGRGIMVGTSANGDKAVVVYFIMGRSANSQNRVFVEKENGDVMIYPFDESKVEDPSLIIYAPIRTFENKLIVTNGDQTDTIYDFLAKGSGMKEALETREFEPDGPNWTPRISSMLTFNQQKFTYDMSILKSADAEGSACNRFLYTYHPINGVLHFIHTYQCDGHPIPTFQGEPERLASPNVESAKELAELVFNALDPEYRISLYAKMIDLKTGNADNHMINKWN